MTNPTDIEEPGPGAPFERAYAEFSETLTAFAATLLAAAGRQLAVAAYRDAIVHGSRRLRRRGPAAKGTVLLLLPTDCDNTDQEFRLAMARAFNDLAADIAAGRLPQPRCGGEAHALQCMLDAAPRLLSQSDRRLRELGVEVPADTDEHDYRSPQWDSLGYVLDDDGLEFTIPEARSHAVEQHEDCHCDWTAVRYWFSPYSAFDARSDDRDHPGWVITALKDGLSDDDNRRCDQAAELLGLNSPVDPWSAFIDDWGPGGALGEVLTDEGAEILIAASHELAEIGYHEVTELAERPFEREHYRQWDLGDSVLGSLPAICDNQNSAWRMAMIRAFTDLADDLTAGRAPIPRCNAEEIALHLILNRAGEIFDRIDDDDEYAIDYGLPAGTALTARHRQLSTMRDVFFQDDDVLMHYDLELAEAAADPDDVAMRYLNVGDIRPPSWWWTFGNLTPRPAARGFPAHVLAALHRSCPFPASNDSQETAQHSPVACTAELTEQFETFVGLAQQRFFDISCAVAMATSFAALLAAYLDCPQLSIHRVWMLGSRAHANGEMLLFDRDFVLDGLQQQWRLRSDLTDGAARTLALEMLADCSRKVLHLYATNAPELLSHMSNAPTPRVDPELSTELAAKHHRLARVTTLARFLTHRRSQLELNIQDVADAALMPAAIVADWETGASALASQLIRCAPVMQLPEEVLLLAAQGHRTTGYWQLPKPKSARLDP